MLCSAVCSRAGSLSLLCEWYSSAARQYDSATYSRCRQRQVGSPASCMIVQLQRLPRASNSTNKSSVQPSGILAHETDRRHDIDEKFYSTNRRRNHAAVRCHVYVNECVRCTYHNDTRQFVTRSLFLTTDSDRRKFNSSTFGTIVRRLTAHHTCSR